MAPASWRKIISAILAAAPLFALPQQGEKSLFLTVRPDITVLIEEHQTGAEDVVVNVNKAGYPAGLLREQVEKIGQLLGGTTNWLHLKQVGQGEGATLTAAFSVNGLIDRNAGLYRLQPIVRAFAGAPEPHTVKGFQITLAKELGKGGDVMTYELPGVLKMEAMRMAQPDMLEYRVLLLSQDPDKIVIPEKHQAPVTEPKEQPKPERSPLLFYVLIGVAALAAGALVYLALLRVSPKRPA